jgi:hypothetical protein
MLMALHMRCSCWRALHSSCFNRRPLVLTCKSHAALDLQHQTLWLLVGDQLLRAMDSLLLMCAGVCTIEDQPRQLRILSDSVSATLRLAYSQPVRLALPIAAAAILFLGTAIRGVCHAFAVYSTTRQPSFAAMMCAAKQSRSRPALPSACAASVC